MNKSNWKTNLGNVLKISEAIEALGVEVLDVEACAHNVDGAVWVSDDVCVAVAADGSYLRVTHQSAPGVFNHLATREFADVAAIVADIQSVN